MAENNDQIKEIECEEDMYITRVLGGNVQDSILNIGDLSVLANTLRTSAIMQHLPSTPKADDDNFHPVNKESNSLLMKKTGGLNVLKTFTMDTVFD